MLFTVVDYNSVLLIYCNRCRNDSYTLRFDTMELDKAYNYEKVRRLTNSDSEEKNPYFPTKWRLFWWNSTNWEEYDKVSTLPLVFLFSP